MTKPLMNITETSLFLGIAKDTIYAWVHKRQIPFVKLGGRLFFKTKDIEQFIEDNTFKPAV